MVYAAPLHSAFGCGLRERIWGGGAGSTTLTPNFEAQIFVIAVTPLRDVGKISPTPPPPYTNTGSAPGPKQSLPSRAPYEKWSSILGELIWDGETFQVTEAVDCGLHVKPV